MNTVRHSLPQVSESEGEKDVVRLSFQAEQPASGAAENLALLLNEISRGLTPPYCGCMQPMTRGILHKHQPPCAALRVTPEKYHFNIATVLHQGAHRAANTKHLITSTILGYLYTHLYGERFLDALIG